MERPALLKVLQKKCSDVESVCIEEDSSLGVAQKNVMITFKGDIEKAVSYLRDYTTDLEAAILIIEWYRNYKKGLIRV